MSTKEIKKLTDTQIQELTEILKIRFEKYPGRHAKINWTTVQARLESNAAKLWSLNEMERTGGEPDVIGQNAETSELLFCDCAAESPSGRRSVCYDRDGQESRKEHRPKQNAVDSASEMGIEVLDEQQYRQLQQLGTFDQKTSSWIKTPADIRNLGGALFADYRYGKVFVYHNGAQSYYAARGFRGLLKI